MNCALLCAVLSVVGMPLLLCKAIIDDDFELDTSKFPHRAQWPISPGWTTGNIFSYSSLMSTIQSKLNRR